MDGRHASLLHGVFIDARGVKIANLLCDRITRSGVFGGLLQNALQKKKVVLVELSVHRPGGLVRRYRIVLLPPATGVLVKIHAWVGSLVHGGEIEAWSVWQDRFLGCLGSSRLAMGRCHHQTAPNGNTQKFVLH